MTAAPQTYYLVGIKGVAMTALAQVLIDAGHRVQGSDVSETFVTQPILDRLAIPIDTFAAALPADVDQVIFTAAHQASRHPQVQTAVERGIPILSHAEALATWFNQKQGVAVCGVGGKSTISAMLAWILEKSDNHPSYAVGVGDIIGLNRTGTWDVAGTSFVAEADEYAIDPGAVARQEPILPRFHYLRPSITIASTISFDHPDVYTDEAMTRRVFTEWFATMSSNGTLISSDENRLWLEQAGLALTLQWYGEQKESNWVLATEPVVTQGKSQATIIANQQSYQLSLAVPGSYNMKNALAAIAGAHQLGVPVAESNKYLATFHSTKRRFEHVGTFHGVDGYDDYAHHPREIMVVLKAARQWFGDTRVVVAFQPHTYSRTKALLSDFITALSQTPEVVLLDIFASARESEDPTISSDLLCDGLRHHTPTQLVRNVHTIEGLAAYVQTELHSGDVLLTLGAGDIYTVYTLLGATKGGP